MDATIIVSGVTSIVVATVGLYFKYGIGTKIKTIYETVPAIKRQVEDNYRENKKEHVKLFKCVEKHNTVVEHILIKKDIKYRIEDVASKALEYLNNNETYMGYIEHKSKATKQLAVDICDSNFKLTSTEVKAKIRNYICEVREWDSKLSTNLIDSYSPERTRLEKEFQRELIIIVTDNITNSKRDRFETAIISFFQREVVIFVKTALKHKENGRS